MRICIFGAGAVGSHLAVRLARAGHEVCCVMRGPHLDAVRASGLTLRIGDRRIFSAGEGLRRSGGAGSAGCRHQHAEGDRPEQPGRGPAAAAARRHRRGVRAERHSLVVRPRASRRSSAAARPRLSRSRRPAARRRPRDADHRRRDLFVERGGRARNCRQPVARSQPAAGRRMRRPWRPSGSAGCARRSMAASIGSPPVARIRETIWSKLLTNMSMSVLCLLTGQTARAVRDDPALRGIVPAPAR